MRLAPFPLAALLALSITGCGAQSTTTPAELNQLMSRLSDPQQNWSAAARLQKLGQPAIAALSEHLRQDPFADNYHGNHSPTMKVLEKIGEPAVPRLVAMLTPELLQSRKREDIQYVASITCVLARISPGLTALALIRAIRSEDDRNFRLRTLYALRTTEETPAALNSLLPEIENLLNSASDSWVRVEAANLLARWGADRFKADGERQLLALAADPQPYVRAQAIRALGSLRIQSARDLIKKQSIGADDELKRAVPEALLRLNDPGYVSWIKELMSDKNETMRRWAIQFARDTRNTAFVPNLIERLSDNGWNGSTTSQMVGGKLIETRHTLEDSALEALRALTFQAFGPDPAQWRRWWDTNRTKMRKRS